ncbi:response regulator [Brevundimonas pishanensis]|uniref:response regulator n=1 Tax=Brevundimonas pishanensis TaxID=2896315 RepID=UPI001FA734B8|nr:response regulator [Brevundimonas pishanensis]
MSNSVKIVMIEDDHGHAKLIEKNIRRANISNDILHFDNGEDGLNYLLSDDARHDSSILILLDLNLPDMSGVDILTKVKGDEVLRRAPVVILTTTDDRTEIQHCYDLGCNVYITKPVDYDAFASAIRQLGLFLSVIQAPTISAE